MVSYIIGTVVLLLIIFIFNYRHSKVRDQEQIERRKYRLKLELVYMLDFLIYKEKIIIKKLTDKDRVNDYYNPINTKAILNDSEKINKELYSLLLTLNGMDIPNESTDDRLSSLRDKMKCFSRDWDGIESWDQIVRFG